MRDLDARLRALLLQQSAEDVFGASQNYLSFNDVSEVLKVSSYQIVLAIS